MITLGSLFSGIGGMELGMERAGMTCVYQVEKDEYARRVLAKHWPDVVRFDDVREVGKHNLPYADVICGGFPCQDISYAGKGAGLGGERSGLWYEFARIIGEMEPRVVVVENVAALLTRGLDAVLGTLASLGYDAEWHCLPASYVGAPHRRDRLFLVAYTQSARRQQPQAEADPRAGGREGGHGLIRGGADVAYAGSVGLEERKDIGGDTREKLTTSPRGRDVSDTTGNGWAMRGNGSLPHDAEANGWRRSDGGGTPPDGAGEWWAVEPDVDRVVNGVPFRVDRLRGLGNAVVPQVAQFVAEQFVLPYLKGCE